MKNLYFQGSTGQLELLYVKVCEYAVAVGPAFRPRDQSTGFVQADGVHMDAYNTGNVIGFVCGYGWHLLLLLILDSLILGTIADFHRLNSVGPVDPPG